MKLRMEGLLCDLDESLLKRQCPSCRSIQTEPAKLETEYPDLLCLDWWGCKNCGTVFLKHRDDNEDD